MNESVCRLTHAPWLLSAHLSSSSLACDDLPNMEAAQIFGNKTDAFVKVSTFLSRRM